MSDFKNVCIISGKRTPFVRSSTRYMGISNRELIGHSIKALVDDLNLKNKQVGEVIIGAVSKHTYDFGLAREAVVESGLSLLTPATDIQKACGTSLEALIVIASKISLGLIDCGIAGGVDTNSDVPLEFKKQFSDRLLRLNASKTFGQRLAALKGFSPTELLPKLPGIKEPRTGLSMGESCELMAKAWQITRDEQDELSFRSHQNAAKALQEQFFSDQVTSFKNVDTDQIIRSNTTIEKLSKLRPCFDRSDAGTLTAGNSSSLTDGSSCTLLCSEDYAKKHGFEILAKLTFADSAAVDYLSDDHKNHGLLMAPTYAVSKMLQRAELTFDDFDFFEIHEAFAAQVLCSLKAWENKDFCKNQLGRDEALGSIPKTKLNVNGGSIAIGHPFAATGSRIVTSLSKMLSKSDSGRGLISICTAGGMGVCAILEK